MARKPKKYLAADFDKMLKETKPDCVIVTCPDAFHDDYIVRALDAGCDCITEKPLTTTPEKAQRIVDACKRNNRHVRVLFNYRYSPPRTQVKDMLMSGAIGDVMSVDFHWLLNTSHGADYFRRWHSNKEISGGLMIHKATHHFDLVNWWLGSEPEIVQAYGKREFYTPKMAQAHGAESPHERCLTCPEKAKCTFYLDIARGQELQGAVPRQREARRLFPRPLRVPPGHQHRGHDERHREVPHRRDAVVLAERVQCLGGLHDRLQRHQGPPRASHRRRRRGLGRRH